MAQTVEYQIIQPSLADAREVLAFQTAQRGEQFAAAGIDPVKIAGYVETRRKPDAVDAYRTSMDLWNTSPDFYYRTIEGGAAVHGLMLARRAPRMADGRLNGVNEIRAIAVAEQLRGTGAASKLMDEFLYEYADPAAFTRLAVLFANVRARDYFRNRWGFEPLDYGVTIKLGKNTSAEALTMQRWPSRIRSTA
jgi:GNAT superfamily N-acetyltransferase